MVKENNVHIKLEVCKDKSSGKLYMRAYFDSKAPNIIKEKDCYTWQPTIEEKNLLNEAFELMPTLDSPSNPSPPTNKIEEKKEEKSFTKFFSKQETKVEPEVEIKKEEPKEEPKEEEIPKIETEDKSDVFEVTDEVNKKEDFKKIESEIESSFDKIDETKDDKHKIEEEPSTIGENDGIIVEADSEAIEAALKKHIGKNEEEDNSIVEADEKTIIDRVLKQKKKGKWRE